MIKKMILLFAVLTLNLNTVLASVAEIEKHLAAVVSKQVALECPSCTVSMSLFNKRSLADIHQPDEVHADHWKGQTNLVMKLGEKNQIITADIRWMDQVVVAEENIKQGEIIKESDLRVVEKDVTYLNTPYLNDKSKAVGLTVKRMFQRGQVIDESVLKKPIVVRYGQPIQLLMENGPLKLTIEAQAKGAGAVGDSIPVYIIQSKTKLQATIVDHGLARLQ